MEGLFFRNNLQASKYLKTKRKQSKKNISNYERLLSITVNVLHGYHRVQALMSVIERARVVFSNFLFSEASAPVRNSEVSARRELTVSGLSWSKSDQVLNYRYESAGKKSR